MLSFLSDSLLVPDSPVLAALFRTSAPRIPARRGWFRHGLGVGKQAGKLVTPASAPWEAAVALVSGAPALSTRELVS